MTQDADTQRRNSLRGLVAVAAGWVLPGCGGGGSGGGAPAAYRVEALTFVAGDDAVAPGKQTYLRVQARMTDGTVLEVALAASWRSSNTAVATVGLGGNVVGIAQGTVDITATYEGFSATTPLRVGDFLVRLELFTGFRLALGLGSEYRMNVGAHRTTGSSFDAAGSLQWHSSNTAVAEVSNGATSGGTVRGVAPGEALITASLDGVSTAYRMAVHDHHTLDTRDGRALADGCRITQDGSGRALAVWSRSFIQDGSPDITWASRLPGQAWTPPEPLRPTAPGLRAGAPALAQDEAGGAVAAWFQPDGVYAARFNFDTGWQTPQRVTTETSLGFFVWSFLHLDRAGNALLLWCRPGAEYMFFASELPAAGTVWSAPMQMGESGGTRVIVERGGAAANVAGDAVFVRSVDPPLTLDPTESRPARLLVRRRVAGVWEPEELVAELTQPTPYFDVAMDDGGEITVAWTYDSFGPLKGGVRARQHRPGQGWGAVEDVLSGSDRNPLNIQVTARAGHGAAAAWLLSYDDAIAASWCDPAGSWSAPTDVTVGSNGAPSPAGIPTLLAPRLLADGRLVVCWLADDFAITGTLGTRVRARDGNWAAIRRGPHVGRLGSVTALEMHWGRGEGAALLWVESGTSYMVNAKLAYLP